jgi:hypothetical protein
LGEYCTMTGLLAEERNGILRHSARLYIEPVAACNRTAIIAALRSLALFRAPG